MRVPGAVAAARMTDLDETNVVLNETPGKEELTPEVVGGLLAERVRHPCAQRRMVELASAMPGCGLDDGGEVVAFVAPHRAHDGELVDHAADVRKPVGDRDARFAVLLEGAQDGDHGPLHLRDVI